jgi:hypothetical protein
MRGVCGVIALGLQLSVLPLWSCAEVKPLDQFPNSEHFLLSPRQGEPSASDLELLLRYYHSLTTLSEEKLQRELTRAWQAAAIEPTGFDRLRLILLLSLPGSPIQDRDQARSMLQSFLKADTAPDLHDLALLLQGFLLEEAHQQRRYRLLQEKFEQTEEQVKRLKSGLKYLNGHRKLEQEWAKNLEQRLADERGRAETLEQKLEALKSIEKKLEYRSQPEQSLELPEQSKELDE